ncbi:MAG: bifunctional precorrin-2 dehydrogenase/sirohydrochlorin ferrochelatase [Firmicutes bacterium]|jgi:precorrin-2 dehydrogenase/sirohydrochlorin ferrochelatase|nr:bifunctional precorrin-2 dehydrogenase/sirohydrochlorin ferrochelatase [Bacillota bacterium]
MRGFFIGDIEMAYVPILLDLGNLRVLFVGAGRQARNKLENFVENGATIRIVSPRLNEGIKPYVDTKRVQWIPREYRRNDLHDVQLVMACTDDEKLNRQVVQDAIDLGILAGNISLDGPRNIQMMAHVRRESLVLGVSTLAQAPLLAPVILRDMVSSIDPRWPRLISALHRFRQDVLRRYSPADRPVLWKRIKTFPFRTWLAGIHDQNWTDSEWDKHLRLALEKWQG